jgi:hypothetical protein
MQGLLLRRNAKHHTDDKNPLTPKPENPAVKKNTSATRKKISTSKKRDRRVINLLRNIV